MAFFKQASCGNQTYPTLLLLQSQPPTAPAASLCSLCVALHGMWCSPQAVSIWDQKTAVRIICSVQYHIFSPPRNLGVRLSLLPTRLREDEQNNSMSLFFFNWRLITLQYCGCFCHKFTWISSGGTWVPHPERPPPTSLPIPSLRSIPVHQPWAPCLMHWTSIGDLFHIYISFLNRIFWLSTAT